MKNNKKTIFYIFTFVSAIVSFNLGFNGWFYFIFSLFLGWLIILNTANLKNNFSLSKWFLFVPLVIFLLSHFLPFLLYGPHPLGYDTGFYKHNLVKERVSSLGDLKISEVESTGSRIINKSFIFLGANDWFIMYGVHIIACLLIGLMIYLLALRYFNSNAAFFSVYLYSISFVQYLFYWNMFWKNSIAIFLLLLIFYLIDIKNKYKYFLIIPLSFFVFITHKTSAILLFLNLLFYFLFKKDKVKFWLLPILILFALLIAWLNKDTVIYLWGQILSGFTAQYDFFMVKEGIFIEVADFLNYSFWYIPFGILGILISIRDRKIRNNNLFLTFSVLSVSMVIVKFVFYKRIFPYLDLSLILYSGLVISLFVDKIFNLTSKTYGRIFVVILLLLPLPLYFKSVYYKESLISKEEVTVIENLKNIAPHTVLFTYNSYYTPWLYGFSGHKIISPGWGDDKWTLDKWNIFWSSDSGKKISMLKEFKTPLLIYNNNDGFFNFKGIDCVEKIRENLYLFKCK